MSPRRFLAQAAVVVAAAISLSACGDATATDAGNPPPSGGAIVVSDAWVRATSGTQDTSMTGAFMAIDNTGEEDVVLTGASSSVAPTVELHEMAMAEGAPVMREVEGGIELRAGRGKALMPGGYHVMLMGLTDELAPGDEVDLSLQFSDGTTQQITAPVKEFTEEEPHYHESGSAHPSGAMSGSPSPGGMESP